MQIERPNVLLAAAALTMPGIVNAQEISPIVAVLGLSPVLVIGLAVTLGVVLRSWRVGIAHAGLVGVWILLFAIASYWVENDFVIWTPLALYVGHTLIIVIGIWRGVLARKTD